jgi:hypothetical protein
MAVPTIISISPTLGHTGGGSLVEILGTGFRVPTPQTAPSAGEPVPVAPPSIEVEFGGVAATRIQFISDTRIFVVTPEVDEADVDVVLRNIDDSGVPIAGEEAIQESVFSYRRPQLHIASDLTNMIRALILTLRRQIHPQVSLTVHTDFDDTSTDLLNIAKLASVPALVLQGPKLEENRFYSLNQLDCEVSGSDPEEFFIKREPYTCDVGFEYLGVSNLKVEHLNLSNAVVAFFRKNKFVEQPSTGRLCELDFETGGQPRAVPRANNDNLRTFRGSFLIRGFDLGEFPGFTRDQVVRAARTTLDAEEFLDLLPTTQTGQTFPVGAHPGDVSPGLPAADPGVIKPMLLFPKFPPGPEGKC